MKQPIRNRSGVMSVGVPWSLMDSAIALLSTQRAARRYAGKVAISNLRRGYEGGGKGRATEGWYSTNSSTDVEISLAGATLRSRSRDLVAALLTISKKLNSQTKSKRKLKLPDETGAIPRESVVNTQDNPQNALNFGRDTSSGSRA